MVLRADSTRRALRLRALVVAVGAIVVGCDAPPEPSSRDAASVAIDLTEPLRCTVLGEDGADAAHGAAPPTRLQDAAPFDAFLRLPADAELSFRVERADGAAVDPDAFRITVASDASERTLAPERSGDGFRARLDGFDGDVVRLRFENLAGAPLAWIAPTVRGSAVPAPPPLGDLPAPGVPFDVVLYVVDTLRADRMSLYGHARETTPNLERRAARALVFDHAYANGPSTLVTMPALFSSRHASMLRAQLRPESGVAWTIAERLSDGGYATGGFQANPWVNPKNGFDRGFDTYETIAGRYVDKTWKNPGAPEVHARALAWLDATRGDGASSRPFFLFLQTMDVHAPYEPPPPFRDRFGLLDEPDEPVARRPIDTEIAKLMASPLVADQAGREDRNAGRYEGEIAYADAELAAFLDALDARGLAERTVVFVTADHGEALGNFDDGTYLHGHSLHEELVRVPLVVLAPWLAPGDARRIERPVSVLDLAPTIFDVAGLAGGDTTGRSLFAPDPPSCARAVQGELTDPPHHRGAVADGPRPVDAWFVREGRWKLLGGPRGRALFDLDADPRETRDVSAEHPIVAAYLAEIRRASVALGRAAPDFAGEAPRAPDDQRAIDDALRKLGYIE